MASSIISRLRMSNMFPGEQFRPGPDPMQEVIDAGKNLALWKREVLNGQGPRNFGPGMRMLQQGMGRPFQPGSTLEEPLRFGGVREQSNPGANILNRAAANAERLYDSYSQPLNPDVKGPSNDEINLERYIDRQNKTKVADAALVNAEGNANYKQSQLELAEGRLKDQQNRTDIAKGQADLKTEKEKNAQLEKEIEKNNVAENNRRAVTDRAQEALDELNQLIDDKGQLTSKGQWGFGTSHLLQNLPFTTPASDAGLSIDRLKSLLTMDVLKQLKALSTSGATGFGQMNLKELGILEKSASKLQGKLSEEDAATELNRIREHLSRILMPEGNQNKNTQPNSGGRIRVRRKDSGKTGSISENAFNPELYDRM